nr:Fe-S cluster assembly protein SufD [Nakamurella alba]
MATDTLSATPETGIAEHTHVGGRTVAAVPAFLHPQGSTDLADHPVPGGREELWRFTPLRRLRGVHDDAPLTGDTFTVTVDAPQGVSARSVSGAEAAELKGSSGYLPTDRPSARAFDAADSVFLVDIPADAVVEDPISVTFTGTGTDTAIPAHLLIRAGRFASASVVVAYEGSATLVENVEIVVGDGARLTVVGIDEWGDATGGGAAGEGGSVHLAAHHLSVGRDAVVKHALLAFGGDLVRSTVAVDYTAPGGDAELLGLYFADAGQHLEQRLFVDHDATHCKSNVLYKGALQGNGAHTVWVGDVLIRATAEGTDTYEMNRNLILTDGARADSVPNLEIETGEIAGAGHASATGRFDDDQLFYLLSRGIPEDVARRLVVRGFFGEVLQRIGVPSVVERAAQTIERELEQSGI